jgi:hypothetical protein
VLLAPALAFCCHVILHHGALLQLVFDRVGVVWASCLEKFLEVICRQSPLALKIRPSGGNKLLVGVAGVLAIIIFTTTSSDCDSLGLPPWPPYYRFRRPSLFPCRWL